MIPLDPEEIFGCAIWDALKRVFAIGACLYVGSICSLVGFLGAGTLAWLAVDQDVAAYLPYFDSQELLFLPFWTFGSATALIALPNIAAMSLHFLRKEAPSRKRFIQFATIQQIALAGAFAEWNFSSYLLRPPYLGHADKT